MLLFIYNEFILLKKYVNGKYLFVLNLESHYYIYSNTNKSTEKESLNAVVVGNIKFYSYIMDDVLPFCLN